MEALINLKTSFTNRSDDYADISLTFVSASALTDKDTIYRYALRFTNEVRYLLTPKQTNFNFSLQYGLK